MPFKLVVKDAVGRGFTPAKTSFEIKDWKVPYKEEKLSQNILNLTIFLYVTKNEILRLISQLH